LSKIYDTPKVPIKVRVGESFAISLESNPTTGFTWNAEYDSSVIEESKSRCFISTSKAVGAGGKELFEFQPKRVGSTFIIMKYNRSWEPKAPRKTLTFKVEIKG
jgi:inhibitor of cysteine peptidase